MQVTKGTLHMHKRCVSGAASDFFLCETSMGQTEQVILIENSQAGSNILSISVQASQVSCIVREIHTFMGHLTLTCMDTNLTQLFSSVCSSISLASLFLQAHESGNTPH